MVENSKALVSKLLVLANAKWGLKRHFKDVRAFREKDISMFRKCSIILAK